MSNACITWHIDLPIPDGPKHVLAALADHGSDCGGEDWTCYPGEARLMKWTSQALRTMERNRAWLVAAGLLSIELKRDHRGRMIDRRYVIHRDWTVAFLTWEQHKELLEKMPKHLREFYPQLAEMPSEDDAPEAVDNDGPPANMAGGEAASPPAKNPGVHPPNSGPPPANMAGGSIDEPSTNPKEPPGRAGEPATSRASARDGGGFWQTFDKVAEAVPPAMRKATKWKIVRKAWSKAARQDKPEAILAAALACGADPDMTRRFVLPGLDVWLSERMFAEWLPRSVAAVEAAAATASAPLLEGAPSDLLDMLHRRRGEAWARSWLTGAIWRGEDRTIVTRLGLQADTVGRELRADLAELNVKVKSRADAELAMASHGETI